MIEERAVVTQLFSKAVLVESVIKSTCSQCQQVDSCGNGQVAKALPKKTLSITIPTERSLNVGDEVVISLPERYLMQSAWQVYMWPLFALIAFAGVGQHLLEIFWLTHEIQVIFFAVIGGFLGSKLAKWWQHHSGMQEQLIPKITQVISKDLTISHIS